MPKELFQTFSKEQQEEFIEDINEYLKEGKENLSLDESIVVHPVIRRRYENKFAYLILRYLDEFVDFPTLRFQIHLGNYVHHRQVKTIEGTNYETTRVIKEKIKVFGKLSEVSNLKTNYLENNNENSDIGWDLFPNPSYNFVSDNIPIFINLQKSQVDGAGELFGELRKIKAKINKSNKARANHKNNKEQITRLIDNNISGGNFKNVYIGEPSAILSLNELPSLLYELLIKKKTPLEIENKLVDKMIKRFEIISNYSKEDNLPTSKITKKLRKSESENVVIDTAKLIRAIEKEAEITEEKLSVIKENKKEVNDRKSKRKHLFYFNELGKEATWLANDIKRFMPSSTKEKWKGQHHSLLQQSLAFFSEKKNETFNLINQFWDFEDEHYLWNKTFKQLLQNEQKFEDIYEKYLKWRKEFFNNLITQLKGFVSNKRLLNQFIEQQNIWIFFYKRLYIIDSHENQKRKLLAKPLVFPRGIFDDKPTYIKGISINDNPELYAEWYQYSYKTHPLQKFYNFERDYEDLFDKEHINPKENKYNLSINQKFTLFKQKYDKKIKTIKTQDLFLKLVAEDIFEKLFNYKQELSLSDFYLTQQERLEKEKVAYKQSKRSKGDNSSNIIKDNFIWSYPVPYIKGQINEPSVRIKDIGKFKYFLQDSKVKRVLKYEPERKWTKKELENELSLLSDSYEEIRRENLLKTIQSFEKFIIEKNGGSNDAHPIDLEDHNDNPSFKLYIANGVLKKFRLVEIDEICWLKSKSENDYEKESTLIQLSQKDDLTKKAFLIVYVRNKFAHNQLPTEELFDLIKEKHLSNKEESLSYSKKILNFVNRTIDEMKDKMK